MNRKLVKLLRWFDDGAPMLRLVAERLGVADQFPDDQDYYACPCCLTVHDRAAVFGRVLTEEHVPAKVVGGRGLVLTCKDCNGNAGSEFDWHSGMRRKADEFARGTYEGVGLPVTITLNGIILRGETRQNSDGIHLVDVPKKNDPKVVAAFSAAMDKCAKSGSSRPDLSFTVHTKFDDRRARYSTIRSAYLAAFAALGYAYILQDVMKPYRQQMKHPDLEIVPTYLATDETASPDVRRVLLVTEPDDIRCVAVTIGQETIFLPGIPPWRPQTCEKLTDALKRRADDGQRLTVQYNGKLMPWPSWATYFLESPASQLQ